MAKQGQIYIIEFPDSIYVGQTDKANATDQYILGISKIASMLVKPQILVLITNITVLLRMPRPLVVLIFIKAKVFQEAQGERKLSV